MNIEALADEALGLLRELASLGSDSAQEAKREFFARAVQRVDLRFKTVPPKEGRKRGKHVFLGAEVQASDLLGVTQEVRNLSQCELLGPEAHASHNTLGGPASHNSPSPDPN